MIVKITDQHDWMRLALTESKDKKLSLVWSHRGDTASGIGIDKKLLEMAIRKWRSARDNCKTKLGDTILELSRIAEKSQTIEQFLEAI